MYKQDMPWKVTDLVEQRTQFVKECLTKRYSMAELCRAYQISRQTGYECLARFKQEGWRGLEEHSHAPKHHPNQMAAGLEQRILELRRAYPRWGARKLLGHLVGRYPKIDWPAASTIGQLLQREGLVTPRKKRRRTPPYTQPFQAIQQPNDLWCADFKGWFKTSDGERIDPLTMTDAHSRYLLRCQAVDAANLEQVQGVYTAAFREYGMPLAIRTDNGAPFATRAVAGLSRLSVWLMKLGMVCERIKAGHPEQNGRHERMHLTLQAETADPPAANRRAQQRRFAEFRYDYNEVRPHEALGQKTPSSQYQASPRAFPERVPEPEYPSGMQVRRVQQHGGFYWKHQEVFLTETLGGECIGLEPVDDRYWRVYFVAVPIACFDSREMRIHALQKAAPASKT
jgi:transposase InsO family protein